MNSLDNTWLAQNNAFRSNTHRIIYTTLYVPSGPLSATFNCIIILTHPVYVYCQFAAVATKGSRKGKGKATARAQMSSLVINRRLSLDQDRIKAFPPENIGGLIRIYNVSGVKDQRAWDLVYCIFLRDPVKTRHFSKFQLIWPHRRCRSSPFRVWWAAFR
jgi:hypothetical protein